MTRRRATTDDFFARTDKRRRRTPYDEVYKRHTYRVKDSTHMGLLRIARLNGIGLNELIRYILDWAIVQIDTERLELPVEEYVTTTRRLVVEEDQQAGNDTRPHT